MKKILFLMFSLMFVNSLFSADATIVQQREYDLFFSEYIEGSSNNKALEIYNGTGTDVDLGNYRIAQSVNGGGWEYYHEWNTGTILANGDVWVITTDQANTALQNEADEIMSYPSVVHFNGNDARGLEKDIGGNWTLLDVIGVPDEDPGTGWDVAGESDGTLNHTLVRKPEITEGNTDWESSAGTNATDSEWIVYPQDTFYYIGYHSTSGEDTTPPTIISAQAISLTGVQINFSEPLLESTAQDEENYSINGLEVFSASLDGNGSVVNLITDEQTAGENYTITVNNLQDLNENVIEPNSTVDFTGYQELEYTPISEIQLNTPNYEGQTVAVHGIVTIGVNIIQTGLTNAYIQDDSGYGINIYDPEPIEELVRGAEVEITGVVEEYNGTTEITDPQVTVLSTGNPEPEPLLIEISQADDFTLEGTLLKVQGTIYEVYIAGGGTNLNIEDDNNNELTVRVWDSTGLDLSQYQVGFFLAAVGIGNIYNDLLQIVPGYQDQLSEGDQNDTTPPTIVNAFATSLTGVQINFSEPLLESTAQDEENYSINGLEVFSASLDGNGSVVNLTTDEQTAGENYTITVNNLQDLNENVIEPNSTVDFTGYQELDSDLFFSEYIEGSSNNKALEIFNGTGADVDLGNYRIAQSVNGGGWEYYHEWNTGTMMANGDVWVIATDEADQALQLAADEIVSYPSVVHYNGNDARGLEKDTGGNWTLLDVIGVPDEDPGTGWDVAGESDGTLNHTLVRKPEITEGNTDWESSAGTSATDSEWIVYPQDTFDYIGYHSTSGEDTQPPYLTNAVALSLTMVEISFNEAIEDTTAEDTDNYEISPTLTISNAELSASNKVRLTTSEQTPETEYTITVNNIEDLAGNPIADDSTIQFTGYVQSEYTPISDIQLNTPYYEGQTVTIHGIVTIGVNIIQMGLTNAYIQDDSDYGINIYDPEPIEELVRGTEVEITGVVEEYNGTTEITDPQVTVISTGNPEPDPILIEISEADDLTLEGTLLKVQGTVYEVYSAGGGTNLNIEDENNNELTVRVWDTTGLDLSEYQVGFFLGAVGIGDIYNDLLQIVPGYQDQLGEGEPEGYEDITLDPEDPEPGEDVTVTFSTDILNPQNVILFWRTANDYDFEYIDMDSVATRDIDYQATIPGQSQGTTVEFYIVVQDEDGLLISFPENAPAETYSYYYQIISHKAILNIPPRPFDPRAGQSFPIEFGGEYGNKAILRIFNSEGKLVFTAKNLIIQHQSGIYHYDWNGKDKNNKILPLGLYICHLEIIDPDGGKTKTANAPIVIGAPLE